MSKLIFFISNNNTKLFFLLLSSIFFYLISNSIYPDWFAIPEGQIDPFVYWGTGEVFLYIKSHFSQTYYFRRWTINLVNLFFSYFFSPYLGLYFKNSLLLICNFFLFSRLILIITNSLFISFLSLVLFSISSYFVYSIGSNWHQATSLFFLLLILYCIFDFKNQFKSKIYFWFLGFLLVLSIITYTWSIFILLPLMFCSLILNYKIICSLKFLEIKKKIYILIIGIISAVILDHLIALLLGVKWSNIFLYSLKLGSNFVINHQLPTIATNGYLLFLLSNLSFFLPAVLISILLIFIYKLTKNINYLAIGSLIFFQLCVYFLDYIFFHHKSFIIKEYNFFIFPMILIGIILLFNYFLSNFKEFYSKIYLSTLFFITIYFLNNIFYKYTVYINYINIIVFFIFLFSILSIRNYFFKFFFFLAIVMVATLLINNSSRYVGQKYKNRDHIQFTFNKLSYEIKNATNQAINYDKKFPKRLWILDNRPHTGWSGNISSLYGNYSAINLGYGNNTIDCKQVEWILMFSNSVLVTYGFATETDSLNKLIELFKPCGSFIFDKTIRIEEAHTFTVEKIK